MSLIRSVEAIRELHDWENEVCEPEDAWDAYGNWEAWVRRHLPEYAQLGLDEMDEVLKANLYSLWCGAFHDASEIIAVAQRLLTLVDLDDDADLADYERVMAWGGEP
jgi:hypothetical protein